MTETPTAAVLTHETEVHVRGGIAWWTCTCGERGQSFKARYEWAVNYSAAMHGRNSA